jgi:mycothiol synthase
VSELPAGLAAGPLTPADADAVTSVWVECEEHDDGRAEVVPADIASIFQSPRIDAVGVRDDGRLVALAIQLAPMMTWVAVLPSHRGRGVGTWLMDWTQAAARKVGGDACSQSVSEHEHAAIALLERAGYERRWEGWLFEIVLEHEPVPPVLPGGYAIRAFEPGRDERAAFEVFERAFAEWPEYEARPFDDWVAVSLGRPGFAPELLGLCTRDDEVVGAALLTYDADKGWVDQLAVARAHRGRGLGRALLVHAFGVTWRRGGRRCGLGTDSRTGARGLYEHVGMHVRKTYYEYVKPL